MGKNNGVFADASTSTFPTFGQTGGMNATSNSDGATGGTRNANPDSAYWDCEIRARLPGYRSDTISLAGRRMLDAPDVGVIILYPIAGIQGLTASATSGQAPKDARKAYEKGLDAVKKDKPDQAEQEFRKAVQLYPKYAEAWLELGKCWSGENTIRRRARRTPAPWRRIRSCVSLPAALPDWRCASRTGRIWPIKPISCCIWIPTSFRPPTTSTPWRIFN